MKKIQENFHKSPNHSLYVRLLKDEGKKDECKKFSKLQGLEYTTYFNEWEDNIILIYLDRVKLPLPTPKKEVLFTPLC